MSTSPQHLEGSASGHGQPGWSLQFNGPLHRFLQRSSCDQGLVIGHQQRAAKLERDLQRMSEHLSRNCRQDLQSLASMLTDQYFAAIDPVLRWVVAILEGCGWAMQPLHDSALKLIVERHPEYETIFQEMLGELGTEAEPLIAHRNYFLCNNPTALEDWDYLVLGCGAQRKRASVPTGLPALDAALGGGLTGVTVFGGDRGVGKTTFMLSIAATALKADPSLAVAIYSLDMIKKPLYDRLLCNASDVDYRCLERPSQSEAQQLQAGDEDLRRNVLPRLKVYERSAFASGEGINEEHFYQHMAELKKATKTSRLVTMIDLFQRIAVPATLTTDIDRDNYRLDLIRWMRPFCEAIIVTSEIRKRESSRRILSHDDLLGSSRISSDADNIFLLWPTQDADGLDHPIVELNCRIDKGRDGVQRIDVPLWFAHTKSRFSDSPPEATMLDGQGMPKGNKIPKVLNPLAGARSK